MSHDGRIDRYFERWNARDPAGVAALLAPSGTYEDPTTAGPVPADGLAAVVARLAGAFPDLALERVRTAPAGARGAVVEWVLRGTNQGALRPGVNPTGRAVALPGVTVFDVGDDGIASARSYFDQTTLVEQAGLMALVQPVSQGPATFGYSMRVASGSRAAPGVIGLTWIRGRDDAERDRIRGHARRIVQDFLEEPGFIGIVTGFAGDRGFTVTAWEDEAAMQRGLARQHAAAMRELRTQDFVPGVWTSVWKPVRINRIWTRCAACAALEDVSDDHRACSRCGAELPERPAFW